MEEENGEVREMGNKLDLQEKGERGIRKGEKRGEKLEREGKF